jgi:hypothetical protein
MATARARPTRLRGVQLRRRLALVAAQVALAIGADVEAEDGQLDQTAQGSPHAASHPERMRKRLKQRTEVRAWPASDSVQAQSPTESSGERLAKKQEHDNAPAGAAQGLAPAGQGAAPPALLLGPSESQAGPTLDPPRFVDGLLPSPDGGLPGPATAREGTAAATGDGFSFRDDPTSSPAPTVAERPVRAVPASLPDPFDPPGPAKTQPATLADARLQTASAKPSSEPEGDALTLIRMEIKQRLPYFQACAIAAKRRSGLVVRRLQTTWTVAADGSIKDLAIVGVNDPELEACIVHAGSRPFSVRPGADLVIPAPIVFGR